MTREEKRRLVCQRVRAKVQAVVPDGIQEWDPAVDVVRFQVDRFADSLAAWLDEDTPATRIDLDHKVTALIGAWRVAGRRFQASRQRGPEVPA